MSRLSRPGASTLEAYLVGELSPQATADVERAIEHDSSLAAWIDERKAEMAAFPFEPRRRSFADLVAQADASPGPRTASGWGLAAWGLRGAAACFVAAGLALAFVNLGPEADPPPSGIRTKGGLTVRAAVRDERGVVGAFEPGASVRPGDQLRLMFEDPHGGFATVLLEEDSGAVSVLYRAEELGRLTPGRHALPGGLLLDDALGRERIYVILSSQMPNVEQWMAEIRDFRRRRGFEHGWLPAGDARLGVLEYRKVR